MAHSNAVLASPSDGGFDQLTRLARKLNLTAIADNLDPLLKRAEEAAPSYTSFAYGLLQWEDQVREQRKRTRALKRSRLGTVEGIDGYDYSLRPKLKPIVVKELLECRWALGPLPRNILCLGRAGTGKTRVIKALGNAACLLGHSVLYTTTADMLEDLHASLTDGTYKRAFRRYEKPAVLVLDEFGNQDFDRKDTNYLFRLVSARHQKGSIVLASNTGFTNWKRFFPSEAQAVATVDRLIDCATILRFSGRSWRRPQDVHGAELDE